MKITKKTKIVCTIGPASDKKEIIKSLVKSGMNVARINFSHGTYAEHLSKFEIIKEVERELKIPIPIMLDTKGPEIRVHSFQNGRSTINKGDIFKIYSHEILGNNKEFSVNYNRFYETVKPRQLIKIDDGKFISKVLSIENKIVICKALNTHTISNRKGVNIIGGRFSMPFLSEADIEDIKFGILHGISMVAASFVRSAQDLKDLRKLLNDLGGNKVLIISKIESKESLKNIDEIINLSDSIMVARGDLGVEIDAFLVPIVQQKLIDKCRVAGKPIIIATQMLESMQTSPSPTRAEVSDVALAVKQGADCVMLSAETASGKYPVESVKMQHDIAIVMEKEIDYQENIVLELSKPEHNNEDALAISVNLAALKSRSKLIIVYDEGETLTIRIAKTRPIVPIICITSDIEFARRLYLYYGVYPYLVNDPLASADDNKFIYLNKVVKDYKLRKKSKVLLVKSKEKVAFDLKEETLRIVTINEQ